MSEKFGDFFFAHFIGMTFAMKENEASDPVDVGLFSADAVVFDA
jgi:hypothetical protein